MYNIDVPNAVQSDFVDINRLQEDIMVYIQHWVRTEKTPVPQKEVIANMITAGTKNFTTVNALNSLLKKGYIRRAYTMSNKTLYVQIRTI